MFGKHLGEDFSCRSGERPSRRSEFRDTPRRAFRRARQRLNLRAPFALGLAATLLVGTTAAGAGVSSSAYAQSPSATSESISATDPFSLTEGEPSASAEGESSAENEPSANSEVPAAQDDDTATETPTEQPADPTEEAEESTPAAEVQKSLRSGTDSEASLLSAGADGAAAPYVYWNVVDEDGEPVAGASFKLERRDGRNWTGTRNVNDCISGACRAVDRDSDPGEFLAKWIGTDNPGTNPTDGTVVEAGNRYRLTPVNPPSGYEWVSSSNAVDSNTKNWANSTLNFGTFTVKKVNYQPVCLAGYVYGITAKGQIRQVSADGAVSNIGSPVSNNDLGMNGLGIGTGGTPVFAYERTNDTRTASIYSYDVTTGTWNKMNAVINSVDAGRSVAFVAGAVNLDTGRYYFGGYASTGSNRSFRLWEYNPATNTIVYKGSIATDTPSGVLANGDMAFDANGNLFIVRGTGTTTTVYSVTAESLGQANGGMIAASKTPGFTTMDDVNGVAFDADGRAYLGADQIVRSYAMPGWTDAKEVANSLGGSTDLASCGSPPTITIEKFVEGERVADTDQFTLSLRQGGADGTLIGTSTTTGNSSGLQQDRVGPLPTVRNVELYFSETASGTTSMDNYASSYRCLVDGVQTTQGNGTSGSIKIPAGGQSVECLFYNSPLVAQVNVHKQVTDSQGENAEPGRDWTVGATARATSGTVTSSPNQGTQQTDNDGTASWSFRFGASEDKATLNVSELMQDGYEFANGTCEVTRLDGTTSSTELTGPDENPAVKIVPGDVVDCTIVNSVKSATVSLGKQMLDSNGENPQPVEGWTVGATLASGSTSGVSISTPATAQTEADGQVATPWVVDFPTDRNATGHVTVKEVMQDGYEFASAVCVITSDSGATAEQSIDSDTGTLTGLKPGDAAECTFTNKPQTGSVTWTKVDANGVALSGSVWELTGPGAEGASVEIADCIEDAAADCTGADRDPQAGAFKLSGLTWGDYTLVETKAPAGFVRADTEYSFSIGAQEPAQLVWDLGQIENEQRPALTLPLTGGMGTDSFLIAGGVALLAALGAVARRWKKAGSKA